MKRDFTEDNYNYFVSLIEQISDDQWCGLTDWFGDRFLDVKHWLGSLGLYNKTDDIEKYHKELLDRKNTSKTQIKSIFDEISSLDTDNAGKLKEYITELESYRKYAQALSEVTAAYYQVVEDGGNLGDCLNFTADTFSKVADKYKDAYVAFYESQHEDDAAIINQVLSDSDWETYEKRDIRFLIYTAPEPYKSIYLQHANRYAEKYQVVVFLEGDADSDGKNCSNYDHYNKNIYLLNSDSTFLKNDLGPYNTFFHENGHAIDDFEYPNTTARIAQQYVYNGKRLHDIIAEDVTNYVGNYVCQTYNLTTEDDAYKQIMNSLNLGNGATYQYSGTSIADQRLNDIREDIIEHMAADLSGDSNATASDIYGGVTNNAIRGNYGHFKDESEAGSDYTYWYYKSGTATGQRTTELWAEFFAAQMTRDSKDLKSIEDHFPNAYKAMKDMAEEMANTQPAPNEGP